MELITLISLFFGFIFLLCYIVYFFQTKSKNEETKITEEKKVEKPLVQKVETITKKKEVKTNPLFINHLKIGKHKGGAISSIAVSSKHVAILKNNEHHIRFFDLKHFHETDKK